jgi:transposase InsO family protein
MVRRLAAGERIADVADGLRLSSTTVRRWWRRYQCEGAAGLENRSSRPHRSPTALPRHRRRQITKRRHWGWSSLRIARDPALPLSTVVHVQRRLGLARVPRPAPPPVVRYEVAQPGELVHLDIKKLGRFRRAGHRIHGDHRRASRGSGWEYLHVAIDDCTRLAYAAIFPNEQAASTAAFLRQVRRWYARRGIVVQRLLTDNGSGYRAKRFRRAREQLRLRHSFTRPYRPQTNGKAERFIRTCLQEWAYARAYRSSVARASALGPFLRYCNTERFHMGINGRTPQQRFAATK